MSIKTEKESPQCRAANAGSDKYETKSGETFIPQNHYNPSHTSIPNTKTILAQVGGFTPVIDSIRDKLGTIAAVVFGVIWRYCQMENGKCTASQNKIAERSGYSRSTALRSINKLIKNGYIRSETSPGIGVAYYDTGQAKLKVDISAVDDRSDTQSAETYLTKADTKLRGSQLPVSGRHTYQYHTDTPPISERHTKKVLKKDLKESDEDDTEISDINYLNYKNNGHKTQILSNQEKQKADQINYIFEQTTGQKKLSYGLEIRDFIKWIFKENIKDQDIKGGILDYQNWEYTSPLKDLCSLQTWIGNARRNRINAEKKRVNDYRATQENETPQTKEYMRELAYFTVYAWRLWMRYSQEKSDQYSWKREEEKIAKKWYLSGVDLKLIQDVLESNKKYVENWNLHTLDRAIMERLD